MIIGLGSDLCNIERIQASLDRFGARFEQRVFTDVERAKAQRRPFTRAGTYAKRFAAKEALAKAIGLGMRHPMGWQACEVVADELGRPSVQLHGELAAWFQTQGWQAHLSLSDEAHHALAFVVVERRSPLQP